MKTTIQERLNQALAHAGINKAELARRVDLTASSVSQWFSGTSKSPSAESALKIAAALGVSPTWLIMGVGEMNQIGNGFVLPKRQNVLKEQAAAYGAEENVTVIDRRTGLVPLISWVAAGDFSVSPDNYAAGDGEDWLPCPVTHGSRTFAVRVTGESMLPDYADGEVIFVDPDCAFKNGDDVVARLPEPDHAMTFKRLAVQPDGTWLVAVNKEWPKRIIEMPEGTQICGVVIGSFRDRRR